MADLSSTRQLVRRHAVAVMDRTARNVETETKVKAPHVTYELRGSIAASSARSSGSMVEFDVVATAEHARYVAEGTRAHIIRPRRMKVLRFKVGGVTVFAPIVHHPGNRPAPDWWTTPALTSRFAEGLRRAIGSVTTAG